MAAGDTHAQQKIYSAYEYEAGKYAMPVREVGIPVYATEMFQATITSANASSATLVKAATESKSIYITDLIISSDTALNAQLQDNTGTPVVLMEQIYLPANSVFSKQFKTPIKVASGNQLNIITSGAGNISVTVTGYVI